uniref:AMP-dependent synthetase/ligase domain-containing protein n=1 Tax=Naja naja TaxID=35670 RepID=A0A8C7E5W6_NAJNA
ISRNPEIIYLIFIGEHNYGEGFNGGGVLFLLPANYSEFYHWSVQHYSDFWAEFWKFSGITFSRLYDEGPWRSSSRNQLLKNLNPTPVAIYHWGREGKEEIEKVTFEDLRHRVAFYAAAMRKLGVHPGDRVVGYLPNGIHAVEAMLAAASIGAIWSATSPDFGINVSDLPNLSTLFSF